MSDPHSRTVLYADGLGSRVPVTDEAGDPCVRLYLSPPLASQFEAVRERTERLRNLLHVRLARVRGVTKGTADEPPHVEFEPTAGVRLSDVLDLAEPLALRFDIDSILYMLRELLPAISLLHDSRSVTHGVLGPERLVMTTKARLVVVDHLFGLAFDKLRLSRARLWQDFRIGMPPAAGAPRFDKRADVGQIGLVALALVLNRPLGPDEFPKGLGDLLAGACERRRDGSNAPLSVPLRQWFERTLPIDTRRAFATVKECHAELEEVITKNRSYAPSQVGLRTLLTAYESRDEATPLPATPAPEAAREPISIIAEAVDDATTARVAIDPAPAGDSQVPALDAPTAQVDLSPPLSVEAPARIEPAFPVLEAAPSFEIAALEADWAVDVDVVDAEIDLAAAVELLGFDEPPSVMAAGAQPAAPNAPRDRSAAPAPTEPVALLPPAEPTPGWRTHARAIEHAINHVPSRADCWAQPHRDLAVQSLAPTWTPDALEPTPFMLVAPDQAAEWAPDDSATTLCANESADVSPHEDAWPTMGAGRQQPLPLEPGTADAPVPVDGDIAAPAEAVEAVPSVVLAWPSHDSASAARPVSTSTAVDSVDTEPDPVERAESLPRAVGDTIARGIERFTDEPAATAAPPARQSWFRRWAAQVPAAPTSPPPSQAAELVIERFESFTQVAPRASTPTADEVDVAAPESSPRFEARAECNLPVSPPPQTERHSSDHLPIAPLEPAAAPMADPRAATIEPMAPTPAETPSPEPGPKPEDALGGAWRIESVAKLPWHRGKVRRPEPDAAAEGRPAATPAPAVATPAATAPAAAAPVATAPIAAAAARVPAVAVPAMPTTPVVPTAPVVGRASQPPKAARQEPGRNTAKVKPASVPPPPAADVTPVVEPVPAAPLDTAPLDTAPLDAAPLRRPRTPIAWRAVALLVAVAAVLEIAAIAAALAWFERPASGRIFVHSKPGGVPVVVDGRAVGATPYADVVRPGVYRIEVRDGTVNGVASLEVLPGAQASHFVSLPNRRPAAARGSLEVTTVPPGAEVLVDGRSRGRAPVAIDDIVVGRHTVEARGDGGTAQVTVEVKAGVTSHVDVPIYSGWIAIAAPLIVDVFDGDRFLGTSEDERLLTPPGRRRLQFVNTRVGVRLVRDVDVQPGKVTAVTLTMPTVALDVRADAGTQVFVDGEPVGVLPQELKISLGTREVVLRRPGRPDSRHVIDVKLPGPMTIDPGR